MYKKSKDIAHIYTNKIIENSCYYYIYLYKRKKTHPRGSCKTDPPPSLNPPTRKNIKKGLTQTDISDII
jgi:hypothetical protein